jgi:predicted dehydrogenase
MIAEMKVLLIGFGSIGQRHYKVLTGLKRVTSVDVVSKQQLTGVCHFSDLESVPAIDDYNYFVIATETDRHYSDLCWINENVTGKKILCEKPLFEKYRSIGGNGNKIFVGYVLRFHPLLKKLKEIVSSDEVLLLSIDCGSYLPNWRPGRDYRQCYSAKSGGGGALLDLSHEIDYAHWLAGDLMNIKSFQTHISDLEIESDDLVALIAKTRSGGIVNITLDYFSKIERRRIMVSTNEFTAEVDLISNTFFQKFSTGATASDNLQNLPRDEMFKDMHSEILFSPDAINACDLSSGQMVMKFIDKIRGNNDV